MIQDNEISKKKRLFKQLISNNYFLHFILDTYLQLYILENNKDSNKVFIPGFSIDNYIKSNNLEYSETPFKGSDKNEIINKALKNCEIILKFIFNENITKVDYLLTWGKYYEELKEVNSVYQNAFELINSLIFELELLGKNISTFSETSSLNDIKVKSTLYFLNIFFEFFTFYKLKYDESFFRDENRDKIEILNNDLKYILFNIKSEKFEQNPINELKSVDKKIENNLYIKNIFLIVNPIWSGSEKKLLKNENEVYSKFISGFVNKNSFNNELQLLFHSFDKNSFEKNVSNKGIRMIFILYHFFTCFLNIGGDISELKEYFKYLRLFSLLFNYCTFVN